MDSSVPLRKLKIPMKTKFASQVILFQKTLKFKHVIALCNGRQQALALVPSPQVWAIIRIVVDTLGHVMLNQS